MNCCRPDNAWDDMFDARMARRDLRNYRSSGAQPTAKAIIELLKQRGVAGTTILDIGGGVGAIHHELLDAGAAGAVHADASSSYIGAAREEADRRGHGERVEFAFGDFVANAANFGSADIVTLDRVICCFPDMPALVHHSASRSKRFYAASFPRERWFLRIGFKALNAIMAVRRKAFRIFMHAHTDIDAALRREGLKQVASARTFVWQVVLYAR